MVVPAGNVGLDWAVVVSLGWPPLTVPSSSPLPHAVATSATAVRTAATNRFLRITEPSFGVGCTVRPTQ
jgi:hypothetical protein